MIVMCDPKSTPLTAPQSRELPRNANLHAFSTMLSSIRPAVTRTYPRLSSFVAQRTFTSTRSAMAAKQEWLIVIPDHAGVLEKRMEVRP